MAAGDITVNAGAANLTPSAVQQATAYNYVSSTDLVASGTASNILHQRDVDEQLVKRYGDQGITGLLELHGAKKACTNNVFEHYEEDFIHNSFSATIAAEANDVATLTVAAGSLQNGNSAVRDGDLLLSSADVMYLVTARTSGSKFSIKDVSGGETAGESVAATFAIVGNAWAEGTAQPKGLTPRVHHYSNNTQILKETFEVTGTEATNVVYVKTDGGYLWYLKGESDTFKRFQDYCELSGVLGRKFTAIYDADTDTGGGQVYGTEGLLEFIDTKGQEMDLGGSASIDMDNVDDIVKSLDKYRGAKENAWYAGIDQSIDIDKVLAGQNSNGVAGSASFGTFANSKDMALNLGFQSFSRGGYSFHKKTYDLFNHPALLNADDNFGYAGTGIIIPMDKQKDAKSGEMIPSLRIRYKASNGYSREMEHWLTGSAVLKNKTNQTDALECNYRSERGFEGFAPNRFMLVKK